MVNLDNYFSSFDVAQRKGILKTMNHIPVAKEYSGTYFVTLNDESYFIKVASEKNIFYKMYAELVAERLAPLVNLDSIKSDIALINYGTDKIKDYRYALISKDYRKDGYDVYSNQEMNIYYMDELEKKGLYDKYYGDNSINQDSLDVIWDSYYYHYKDFKNRDAIVENKVKEQVRRFIFRFYIMDRDFHLGNGETLDCENLSLTEDSPMFDMDQAFNPLYYYRNNSMRGAGLDDPYDDFDSFLDISDDSVYSYASSMHNILTPEVLENTIKSMEHSDNIKVPNKYKNEMVSLYSKHYDKIGDILKKRIKVK